MIDFLIEPLSLDFMQQALIIGILVSTASAAHRHRLCSRNPHIDRRICSRHVVRNRYRLCQ